MGPLKFVPILKRLRWGGRRLGELLGKSIGPHVDYAESWEICDCGTDCSTVETGPWQRWDLRDLIRELPRDMLGRHAGLDRFPLLVKFLDAHDRLSVQVHPDDTQAATLAPGQRGKTEAWVIVEAAAGSHIFAGLKSSVDRPTLERALTEGTLEQCLARHEVAPGDCFFIPAGTVHAVGAGIVLAEVQQSSDVTFRLFDWNRTGVDGRPRPLHVQQALSCIDFKRGPVSKIFRKGIPAATDGTDDVVICPFFTLRRHDLVTSKTIVADDRCHILICLDGEWECGGHDESHKLAPGSAVLAPASSLPVQIAPQGRGTILEVVWD